MVVELKEMADQNKIKDRLAKYTKTFDLLDSMGADNCIDPDDFDQEDMEDELFQNLQIADIEELFARSQKSRSIKCKEIKDITPGEEPLLLEDTIGEDSDYMGLDDGLAFMDIDEQIRLYDQNEDNDSKPRHSCPQNEVFKIQGLEEVAEMTDESDNTS